MRVCGQVAEGLARLGAAPLFLSALGDDAFALRLAAGCGGLDMSRVRSVRGGRTAVYAATHSGEGDMVMAVADMALHAHIDTGCLLSHAALS